MIFGGNTVRSRKTSVSDALPGRQTGESSTTAVDAAQTIEEMSLDFI